MKIRTGATYLTSGMQYETRRECSVPSLVNSRRMKPLGAPTLRKTQMSRAPTGSRMLVENVSKKSNNDIPATESQSQPLCDNEHAELKTNNGRTAIRVAVRRRILQRSISNDMVTSLSDMVDVMAATVSARKKSADHNGGHQRRANTSGSVTNMRVTPCRLSPSSPNEVTAGKMISPIRMATPKSRRATVVAVLPRLVDAGK